MAGSNVKRFIPDDILDCTKMRRFKAFLTDYHYFEILIFIVAFTTFEVNNDINETIKIFLRDECDTAIIFKGKYLFVMILSITPKTFKILI